jgi:hypothetical protein
MNTHHGRKATASHSCGPPSYFFIKKQEGGCSDFSFSFLIFKQGGALATSRPSFKPLVAASKEGEPQSALTLVRADDCDGGIASFIFFLTAIGHLSQESAMADARTSVLTTID